MQHDSSMAIVVSYPVRRPPCCVKRNVRYGSQGAHRVTATLYFRFQTFLADNDSMFCDIQVLQALKYQFLVELVIMISQCVR